MARQFPEVALEADGERFTLVYDWAAIRLFEREADCSIYDLVLQFDAAKTGGRLPKLTDMGLMLRAGLARHHPDLDIDRAMDLFGLPGVKETMIRAFALGQPEADGGDGGDADPPQRRRSK
jgi:hypothetical protein